MVSDFTIAETMVRYGGGFVSALGQLWILGDRDNRRRIVAAWPEYWAEFRKIAEQNKF